MSTDDLEDRLRRLGQAPIAPEVEASHRHAMAHAVSEPGRARFGWRAVALAVVAGFLVGSTSLAAAGSLPDPAQDVAHDVLGVVGIGVPRSTDGCPEGTSYRNHGEYVSAVEAAGGDVDEAARSECGKPVHSNKGTDKAKGSPGASTDADGDPCTGPPPWAGTHLDAAAKEAARTEREATCGPDEDADEADEAEDEADEVEEEDPAPKTDATTTTVSEGTTTTTPPGETTTTEAVETTTTASTQP